MKQTDRAPLKPTLGKDKPRILKEHGIWVLRVGEPVSADQTNDILKAIRSERESFLFP